MSGIYGATTCNRKLVSDLIARSSHRGPDGSGIWLNNEITLGHNLLSITGDPEVSRQPWVTPNKNILLFNGELFNINELSSFALKRGYKPRTVCDTEILAWCLDEFGVEYTNNNLLDSMHAYAYYRVKENQIYLSRDHAGIKPIYYILDSGTLIFSSEIKGLLGVNERMPGIDKFAFNSFFLTAHHLTRATVFKGIDKILPGETIKFDLNDRRLSLFSRDIIRPGSTSKFDPEELRSLLKQSTLRASRSTKKTALLLSGGLDSSSIALNVPDNVSAYSTQFYPNYKEKNLVNDYVEDHNEDCEFARKVAESFGIQFSSMTIGPNDVINCWSDAITAIELPSYKVEDPMYFETFKRLKLENNTIVLTGDFGDELFAGCEHHSYWKRKPEKISTRFELISKWLKCFNQRAKPVGFDLGSIDELCEYLCNEIPIELWNEDDPMNSWMALDCFVATPNCAMMRNDKYAMNFGIETRFPMASKAFMKYCFSISSDIKIPTDSYVSKSLLRSAFKNLLPNYIINKPKTGWSSPLVSWNRFTPEMASFRDSMRHGASDRWLSLLDQNPPIGKQSLCLYMIKQWLDNYGYILQ